MSIWYSANLVYGVLLTPEEIDAIQNRPDRDEICETWIHNSDLMCDDGDMVLGIQEDAVDSGKATELGTIHEPKGFYMDSLLDILKELGIERKPTWYLMCSVS